MAELRVNHFHESRSPEGGDGMVVFNQACLNHLLFGGVGPPRKARSCCFVRAAIRFARLKTLTVRVADELFAEISGAARARNMSKSEIVRERLTHKAAPAKRAKGSLWGRMEDLVIHSDSLPAELSANKAHLKNYGRNRSHPRGG